MQDTCNKDNVKNLCLEVDPHEVKEADSCQVEDEGVETALGGTPVWPQGGRLTPDHLPALPVEVYVTAVGGWDHLALPLLKVILQFNLRYGLDFEGTHGKVCAVKVKGDLSQQHLNYITQPASSW